MPTLIVTGLLVDQFGGRWGQSVVVAATWASLCWIAYSVANDARAMMLVCLVYASVGEALLSLVWRVYDYRLGNLPLFVPPGHVLLFVLGLSLAPAVSRNMVRVVAALAALVVSVLALAGRDTFSALLGTVFLLSVYFGRERSLYAAMFVLALTMELLGTWLGNWTWNTQVAQTGMVTLNPPVAAGAFYCLLDLLVMSTLRLLGGMRRRIVSAW